MAMRCISMKEAVLMAAPTINEPDAPHDLVAVFCSNERPIIETENMIIKGHSIYWKTYRDAASCSLCCITPSIAAAHPTGINIARSNNMSCRHCPTLPRVSFVMIMMILRHVGILTWSALYGPDCSVGCAPGQERFCTCHTNIVRVSGRHAVIARKSTWRAL